MPAKVSLKVRSVTTAEYEMLAAFRYALRQFLRFSENIVGRVGLTPQQHQVLLAIRGFPGRARLTIGELAERLQIKHNSAVGLVDRLVSRSLMVRHLASTDRRQVYVSLTPRGARVLERLTAMHREEIRRVGPGIGLLLRRLSTAKQGSGTKRRRKNRATLPRRGLP